MRKAQ